MKFSVQNQEAKVETTSEFIDLMINKKTAIKVAKGQNLNRRYEIGG